MTAAVRVESGDLLKIARNYGAKGKPAPQWVQDNPEALAAYNDAAGVTPAAVPNAAPATPDASSSAPSSSPPPARKQAARRPAATRPATRASSSTPGYLSRIGGSRAASVGDAAVRGSRVGDAGGLLLAFVLYPIVLSTVLYGPNGPTLWFRAKWLNETADAAVLYGPAAPARPAPTPHKTVPA